MIETNEPKDGDFIAYIEQLQKQQAARLVANRHQDDIPAVPMKAVKSSGPFEPRSESKAAETQRAARESFRQSAPPLVRLIGAALPMLVGAAIGLHWLIAGSSPLQLIVALVLLIYGARRIKRALQGFTSAGQTQASALIAQMIARSDKR